MNELLGAPLLQPESVEELTALLKQAGGERRRVLAVGLASSLSSDLQLAPRDWVISTRKLAGIVEYEPAEGVITALAGTCMSQLRSLTESRGHRLTPQLPSEKHRTLGGVIACGRSGPDRLRYGPLRNHVLGLQVADAEGRLTKSGGRLVKNVTGYDLPRLHTGARGQLGILVTASLRLFPLPSVRTLWTASTHDGPQACALAARLQASRIEPSFVSVSRMGRDWSVLVAIEGLPAVVEDEVRALRRISATFEQPDPGIAVQWMELRSAVKRTLSCRPSQLPETLAELCARPDSGELLVEPLIATCSWTGPWQPSAIAALPRVQAGIEDKLRHALDPHATFLRG